MAEYISKQAAVDAGYLSDWYIASVGDESPVWTDEHINELLNDFIVIPKDTPAADVKPVRFGKWVNGRICSECGFDIIYSFGISGTDFCPCCGTGMVKEGNTE